MKRLLFCIMLLATPLAAVEPDEILDDPALENRARALSKGLRCLVCRNESIDESNAELARDLRILVRERLVAGDSDDQAMDFIVARYGEYVLLRPTLGGSNIALWLAGPFMLVLAGGYVVMRRKSKPEGAKNDGLSEAEETRLKQLLAEK